MLYCGLKLVDLVYILYDFFFQYWSSDASTVNQWCSLRWKKIRQQSSKNYFVCYHLLNFVKHTTHLNPKGRAKPFFSFPFFNPFIDWCQSASEASQHWFAKRRASSLSHCHQEPVKRAIDRPSHCPSTRLVSVELLSPRAPEDPARAATCPQRILGGCDGIPALFWVSEQTNERRLADVKSQVYQSVGRRRAAAGELLFPSSDLRWPTIG